LRHHGHGNPPHFHVQSYFATEDARVVFDALGCRDAATLHAELNQLISTPLNVRPPTGRTLLIIMINDAHKIFSCSLW
jgi:hypothetical protein